MIFLPFYILHLKAKVDKAKKQCRGGESRPRVSSLRT